MSISNSSLQSTSAMGEKAVESKHISWQSAGVGGKSSHGVLVDWLLKNDNHQRYASAKTDKSKRDIYDEINKTFRDTGHVERTKDDIQQQVDQIVRGVNKRCPHFFDLHRVFGKSSPSATGTGVAENGDPLLSIQEMLATVYKKKGKSPARTSHKRNFEEMVGDYISARIEEIKLGREALAEKRARKKEKSNLREEKLKMKKTKFDLKKTRFDLKKTRFDLEKINSKLKLIDHLEKAPVGSPIYNIILTDIKKLSEI